MLEGPLPSEERGYSTANYGDCRPLYCGYPDEFIRDIRLAGINFVTVANNHLLDKGWEGMERTAKFLKTLKCHMWGTEVR